MNFSVESLPGCKTTLRIEVPADEVDAQRAQVVRQFVSQARLPGFRPGKAPQAVIEKRFGDRIRAALADRLADEGCRQGMRETELKVLSVDSIDAPDFHVDGSFSCVATLTTAPSFELPDYVAIPVRVPAGRIDDDTIDRVVERYREQLADFEDVEDRPVASTDIAIVDYKGRIEGKTVGEVLPKANAYLAQGHDSWMKLDDNPLLEGFAEQIVGMQIGDTRTVTVTLPDDFPFPEAAGKAITYEVVLKQIKRQVLPEVDDALAAKIEPGKSLADLRDSIRTALTQRRDREIEQLKINQIMAHLSRNLDFEVPPEFVEAETQSQVNEMVRRGQRAGMEDEEIMQRQQEILNAASVQARDHVKVRFILHEIAKKEGIRASEVEILTDLEQVARSTRTPIKKLARQLRDRGSLPRFRENIVFRKTLEFLGSKASVEEFEPSEADETPGQ